MEALFPQALLSTPGMVSLLTIVIIIELLSLAFLWLASYEYRQLIRRHSTLVRAVGGGEVHGIVERRSRIIFWIYVLSTVAITLLTLALFLFQPHLL